MIPQLESLSPENPLLLVGPPGVGKTAMVQEWADSRNYHLLIEHPVIAQSVDYRGLPAVIEGEARWLPLGTLKQICKTDCQPTVVLLDDLGQASASVQAAVMQLVLARKLGDAVISNRVSFVAASNRTADRSGVTRFLAALSNRMQIVPVEPNVKQWCAWALGQEDVSPLVAGYLQFRPDSFVSEIPAEPLTAFCTPRSMAAAGRLWKRGVRDVVSLAGWIGKPTALDFVTWADAAKKLPTIDTLLASPSRVQKIKDVGLRHAIVVMSASKIREYPDDVPVLAEALGGGWNVATISAACDVWPEYKNHASFKTWAINNKGVL